MNCYNYNKENRSIYYIPEMKYLETTLYDNVIRFTPPLIISNEEVDKAISIIDQSLKELND